MKNSSQFIEFIKSFSTRGDKQALSSIRQGLTKTREHYAYKYLAPFCDLTNAKDLAIYKTIGALYAHYPKEDSDNEHNIGHLMRTLGEDKVTDALERKILRLLSPETSEEALEWIKPICFLAKSNNCHFPYKKTLENLLYWGPRAKREIAKAFWGQTKGEAHE